jgi:hypothetical protein
MMNEAMKQLIKNAGITNKFMGGFNKSFDSGFCWAAAFGTFINVAMVQNYYETSRLHSGCGDDDDEYSYMEYFKESDERVLKFFVPKKFLCESTDDSGICGIGFMRGVVAGVEERDRIADRREQYHRGIRRYADMVSSEDIDSSADDAAPLGETATEAPRFEGRGSQPPVLQ